VLRLAVRVRREQAELVLAELLELAPGGVEERDDGDVVEYALYGAPGELPALPDLRAAAGGALVDVATSEVPDGWEERWKAFHEPVAIGARLWVRPPWESARAGLLDVVIDPAQAFGTGAHATTRLCLELLLELAPSGPLVDLGCGSGVLAIAAATLGWAPVLGVDHDRESLRATAANAAANGVEVDVRRFDLLRDGPAPAAGTVLANLLRPLLLAVAEAGFDGMSPPRALIAGGLLAAEGDEVARAFARHGLREAARARRGEWIALLLRGHDDGWPPATRRIIEGVQLAERLRQDVAAAMKAGDRERVGTLRLLLSELQKAAKDGDGDELAVLRRERKRRHESAGAFRDGGRPELAEAEEAEARVIEAYLPAELSDDELRAIVAAAVAQTGASSPRDMGQVMKASMAQVAGRADGRRVSALAQEALRG
jgi:ribosomal protein L11 methyltransferase